ncbi:tagaturonate reductase [Pedobacter immunditicola]|uniref:tagaturonate reductase n=1 Tax=Pedobacter immunditicola TaxID=3133440 RepID=UPI0030AADF34
MILSKENLKNLKGASILIPEASLFELPEKVLQFGTGVLLRGLPDYFIDKANRKGIFNGRIVVVKSTSSGGISAFEQQDNLYTLCIRGLEEGKTVEENIISSAISRVVAADKDWLSVLEFAQNPELKVIISNTTEVGIALVKEQITQNPPASFPAKLLAVLYERYKKFKGHSEGGLVVIPTELVPDNGKKLEGIVQELARFNELGDSFLSWLDLNVEFCSSLVDRIVPGKPDPATLAALEKELGYQDQLLSMAEPYRLWAIEGSKNAASLLTFSEADAGVVITDDIERFRELKVRLLNGTHTLSCGIAVLAEIDTVKNGMTDPSLKPYIKELMELEIGPAIPYKIDKEATLAFSNTVSDRFANPFIEHLWINITVQYAMKMKIRILPLLLNYQKLFQAVPEHIAFGFAAFLIFMKSEEKDGKYYGGSGGLNYPINDDSAAYFNEKLNSATSEQAYLDSIFNDTEFWGTDLNVLPGFKDAVSSYYVSIQQFGIKQALQKSLTSGKRG